MTTIAARTARFRRGIALALFAPMLVLVALAVVLCLQVRDLLSAENWVDHSDQVIAQSTMTLRIALDAETGQRGYVIGGSKVFLEPYYKAQQTIGPAFDRMKKLVANDPATVKEVVAIQQAYDDWNAESASLMDAYRKDPKDIALYFNLGRGKYKMDILRLRVAALVRREARERELRIARVNEEIHKTTNYAIALSVLGGFCLGLFTIRQNVTQANTYESALVEAEESAELLATTLLSIGDAVLATDVRGRVTQLNGVAEQLTGWTRDEAVGKPVDDLVAIIDADTRERVESPVTRVIRAGVKVDHDTRALLVARDGSEIPVDVSVSPIRDMRQILVGVVLVLRDVTERRRAEAELAEAYMREHRIAEYLQRSILSRPPASRFPSIEFDTLYRAAFDEAAVGGDFFDLVSIDSKRIGLVVGDVSGKGLQAASRTAELKFVLRAYLHEHADACAALEGLNRFVCESQEFDPGPNYFVALALAIIDVEEMTLQCCVAGADPPILVRNKSGMEMVPSGGMLLGVEATAEYERQTVTLAPGDLLVMATDGATEARRNGEFLGADGLARIVAEIPAHHDIMRVGESVFNAIHQYADNQLTDDVCLLVARLKVES